MSKIENSFKEALTDFDSISPSTGLWNRIATSLFLKSYAFKAILLSILAFLIVFPTYLFYSTTQNTTDLTSDRTDISNNNFNKTKNKQNTLIANKKEISNQVNNSSPLTNQQKKKPIVKSKTSQTKNHKTSRKVDSQQLQNTEPQSEKVIVETSIPKSKKHNTKTVASVSIVPTNAPITKQKVTEPMIQTTVLNTKQKTSNSTKTVNNTNAISSFEEKTTEANQNTLLPMPLFSEYANTNIYYSQEEQNKHYNMVSTKLLYSSQLEIFAGPSIAFNQLKTTDNKYHEYIGLRQSSESPKLSYHAGINYKTYYNHWFMGIGINYHRIEDYATYSLSIMDIDSAISSYMIFQNTYKQVITGYIQNPNDTSLMIPIIETQVTQDTTLVSNVYYDSTNTTKNYSYTNTYSYIEVPIMIGREFRMKHLIIDVQAGVTWGRLIKTEVNIPNIDNNQMLNSQDLETIFVKNTFNGLIGLGIGYQMNESYILFARPELRYNLNNMFENNNPINQKYLQLRLSLGMRIQL